MQYVLGLAKEPVNSAGLQISRQKNTRGFLNLESEKSRTQTSFFANFYFF